MMRTNYAMIGDDKFCHYLEFLIGKVYKILGIKENQDELNFKKYIDRLLRELIGNFNLIDDLKCDGYFITLMSKIEYLGTEEYSHEVCREEVFESISLIKKIIKNYNLEGDSK